MWPACATGTLRACRVVLTPLVLLVAVAVPAAGQFDLLEWTFQPSTAGGSGSLTPEEMLLVGPDDGCQPPGKFVAYTAVAPFDGTVVVNAQYYSHDEQPEYDNFNYLVDDATILVSNSFSWSGQLVFDVPAGVVFGFSVGAIDCHFGPGEATLSEFNFLPKLGPLPALDGSVAGEHFGARLASAGDVDGDGVPDLIVGVPDGGSAGVATGTVAVVSGDLQSTLLSLAGAAAGVDFGFAVAGGADLNHDGVPDLAVGAPKADTTSPTKTDSGRIQLLSGVDGSVLHDFSGVNAFDKAGFAVALVGDLDGDGVADVAGGAPFHDAAASNAGQVLVLSGATGSVLLDIKGDDAGDRFGSALAGASDIDGDGTPDLIVGAPGVNAPGGWDGGRVTVHSGLSGSILHVFEHLEEAEVFGSAVAGGGDFDGDGVPDVVGAAPDGYGDVFVHSGIDGSLLHTFTGPLNNDLLGSSVAVASDLDGDGAADLVLGAVQVSYGQKGYVVIRSGRTGEQLYIQPGDEVLGQFGAAVAWLGDVDGDDRPEIAVGVPFSDQGSPDAGGVRSFEPYLPWTAEGAGLPGTFGVPELSGKGLVGAGAPGVLTIQNAHPDANTILVAGLTKLLLPFKGGVLVPEPEFLLPGLVVDDQGALSLPFTWPMGLLLPGFEIWLQIWISDPTGPQGVTASNGLHAQAP